MKKLKIIVIGGHGLIGTKLVRILREQGHEVFAASRSSGVDILTGEGLAGALAGADVAVDVTNSPSFEDTAVLNFFETSNRNILPAEKNAGVQHHVALSVVGTDRNPGIGYFRAKLAQENLIKGSSVPYTIVRATQFFEFIEGITGASAQGQAVHLTSARFQPMASDDVVAALAEVVVAKPVNGIVEIGGPEKLPLDEMAREYFKAKGDSRQVITDDDAGYFGAKIDDQSLTAGPDARLGPTRFQDWLKNSLPQK